MLIQTMSICYIKMLSSILYATFSPCNSKVEGEILSSRPIDFVCNLPMKMERKNLMLCFAVYLIG